MRPQEFLHKGAAVVPQARRTIQEQSWRQNCACGAFIARRDFDIRLWRTFCGNLMP